MPSALPNPLTIDIIPNQLPNPLPLNLNFSPKYNKKPLLKKEEVLLSLGIGLSNNSQLGYGF
jgi:hypothetical protein